MDCYTVKKSNTMFFFIVASCLLHFSVILFFSSKNKLEENKSELKFYVKLNIVELKVSQPIVEQSNTNFSKIKSPKKNNISTKENTKKLNYQQLLDSTSNHEISTMSEISTEISQTEEIKKYERNYSKIQRFALEVAEQFSIPKTLKKINTQAKARAVYSRKSTQEKSWKTTEITGERYLRSILYAALKNFSENSFGLAVLNESEYQNIKVNISYVVLSDADRNFKPLTIAVVNDTIFLNFLFKNVAPLGENPDKSEGKINLNWIAKILSDPYLEKDPLEDPEIKRLRLSPAFREGTYDGTKFQ